MKLLRILSGMTWKRAVALLMFYLYAVCVVYSAGDTVPAKPGNRTSQARDQLRANKIKSLCGKGDIGKSMGKMDGFWRYHAYSGALELLKNSSLPIQIESYADYFRGSSFPYYRSTNDYETPHADGFWCGQAMGIGLDPKRSVIRRNPDGSLGYDWDLMKAKFDIFFEDMKAYDLTLVFELPAALVKNPVEGLFDQIMPPDDMNEWSQVVESYCRKLVETYGEDRTRSLGFRIGTEWAGENRFAGTAVQLYEVYDRAAVAIRKVIPTARVGPYNEGMAVDKNPKRYNHYTIARHCVNEPNIVTGRKDTPFDFLCASYFLLNGGVIGGWYPAKIGEQMRDSWDGHTELFPQLLGSASREIHEWGFWGGDDLMHQPGWGPDGAVPQKKEGDAEGHEEVGARGAALTLGALISLRAEAGLSRFYLYDSHEKFQDEAMKQRVVPFSFMWVFNVFDHLRGYDAFALDLKRYRRDAWIENIPFEDKIKKGLFDISGMIALSPERSVILLYAWQAQRNNFDEETINVRIPVEAFPSQLGAVSYMIMDDRNIPHVAIKEDFKKLGVLRDRFIEFPVLVDHAKAMIKTKDGRPNRWQADANAGRIIVENYDRYCGLFRDSLTLKPFKKGIVRKGGYWEVEVGIKAPSVMAIVIDHCKPGGPEVFDVQAEGSSRAIFLKWQDRSQNETGFIIERVDITGARKQISIDVNQQEYVDYDVSYGGRYTYRIKASGMAGDSAWSAVKTVALDNPGGNDILMEAGKISLSPEWKRFPMRRVYSNPVVVCSVNYAGQADPVIVQVRNVASNSFEARLNVVSGKALSTADDGCYIVVEEGNWEIDGGAGIMAKRIPVGIASLKQLEFPASIKTPVVVGQVLSANNSGWASFLMAGGENRPYGNPGRDSWFVGINTGSQEPGKFSAEELVGVIAFEESVGKMNGIEYHFGRTPYKVKGVNGADMPPYTMKLNGFVHLPQVYFVSAAQIGNEQAKYWPVLYSDTPLSRRELRVALDHDTHRMISGQASVSFVLFSQPFEITKGGRTAGQQVRVRRAERPGVSVDGILHLDELPE